MLGDVGSKIQNPFLFFFFFFVRVESFGSLLQKAETMLRLVILPFFRNTI
jgi:hypothetical protein